MKKLLSIFFACLILLSNMGFTIASHYCRGHLVKTQLLHGTQNFGCCMAKMDQNLPKNCQSSSFQKTSKKKGCCENTYQNLELDEDYDQSEQVLSPTGIIVVSTFIYSYLQLITTDKPTNTTPNHSPPLLAQDMHILHQTFLI